MSPVQKYIIYFIVTLFSVSSFSKTTCQGEKGCSTMPTFEFVNSEKAAFSQAEKTAIEAQTFAIYKDMQKTFPEIKNNIHFTIKLMDRDLDIVNWVTGRADRKDKVEISISSMHPEGILQAVKAGFKGTLIHELHHTVRGWTIEGNEFGRGIDIAAVNEGMADVLAEAQIGYPMNKMGDAEDFDEWIKEIKTLPKNANYGQWMFMHPDGRMAVGYRAGAYLVKQAMKKSGKSILELSKLSVEEIYHLAGY